MIYLFASDEIEAQRYVRFKHFSSHNRFIDSLDNLMIWCRSISDHEREISSVCFCGKGYHLRKDYTAVEDWSRANHLPMHYGERTPDDKHYRVLARCLGITKNNPKGHRNYYRIGTAHETFEHAVDLEQMGFFERVRLEHYRQFIVHTFKVTEKGMLRLRERQSMLQSVSGS